MISDDEKLKKSFSVAADNCKFEIGMFWKRTVVFLEFYYCRFYWCCYKRTEKSYNDFCA